MMMEPTPGEFVTDGFMDIVKFAKLAQAAGLLIVLRPGPFICDGTVIGFEQKFTAPFAIGSHNCWS